MPGAGGGAHTVSVLSPSISGSAWWESGFVPHLLFAVTATKGLLTWPVAAATAYPPLQNQSAPFVIMVIPSSVSLHSTFLNDAIATSGRILERILLLYLLGPWPFSNSGVRVSNLLGTLQHYFRCEFPLLQYNHF